MGTREETGRGGERFGVARAVRWVLDGGPIEAGKAEGAFARMHERDGLGDRVMLVLAAGGLAGLMGPQSVAEWACLPLLVHWLVRVRHAGATWVHCLGQSSGLLALAWSVWLGVGVLRSPDRGLGLSEWGDARWAVLGALVWPVLARRGVLVAALAAGLLAGQVSQVVQALGVGPWERAPGRVSGWWDPAVSGTMLVGALGLHAGPALFGRGWRRWAGVGGGACALAGLVASGTRGAWIAAGLLVVVLGLVGVASGAWRDGLGRRIAAVGGSALLLGAVVSLVVWLTPLGAGVRGRVAETRAEAARMLEGDFGSWTGYRVRMMLAAGRAAAAHPVAGVGTGGFQAWAEGEAMRRGEDAAGLMPHAHSTPGHVAATTGAVGLGLLGMVIWCAVRGGCARAAWEGGTGWLGRYAAGPALALVGVCLAGLFDTVTVSTPSCVLFWVLVGLCPCWWVGKGRVSTAPALSPR